MSIAYDMIMLITMMIINVNEDNLTGILTHNVLTMMIALEVPHAFQLGMTLVVPVGQ